MGRSAALERKRMREAIVVGLCVFTCVREVGWGSIKIDIEGSN